jgi:hypothetical protein
MTSKIWESTYHLFKNGTGKEFYKKNYTRNIKGKIQLSYEMTKAINKVLEYKKYYSEWELDFCKSILANNSYTEKQKPYLIKIVNKKI